MAHYIKDSYYIVFDGTSHYEVLGCDIEDEIAENDVEVVEGPFKADRFGRIPEKCEDRVAILNDEAYGTKMYK